MTQDEKSDAGSAPCWMDKADDAYMGYAPPDEVLEFLNEMLAAERAGAQVCHESLQRSPPPWMTGLLQQIKQDEGRWCAMLSAHIKALGGTPTNATGAFRDKAMAIPDAEERLTFLNRGQEWVIRKLRAMRPRIRDDRLHRDLSEMLQAHESNIDIVCKTMEAPDGPQHRKQCDD